MRARGRLLGPLARDQVGALDPLDRATVVLDRVAQAEDLVGVLDLQLRVALPGRGQQVDPLLVALDDRRQLRLLPVLDRVGLAVAECRAGVAEDHGEVALFMTARVEREELLRLEGHVLRAEVGGLAVRADVGAQEGEVAAVARPLEVIRVAAEVADRLRRDVDHARVAQDEIGVEVIARPAEHLDDLRPDALRLAPAGGLLGEFRRPRRDRAAALGVRHPRRHRPDDLRRHVLELLRDAHAVALGRGLLGARLGEESVGDVIILRRARRRHRAEGNVVVGEDESLGRDE